MFVCMYKSVHEWACSSDNAFSLTQKECEVRANICFHEWDWIHAIQPAIFSVMSYDSGSGAEITDYNIADPVMYS